MKKEFFPKVTINNDRLIFNSEAVETMELDVDNSKVILLEITRVEKVKTPKEILVVKTNGSFCDDLENVKDVFPPDRIKTVKIEDNEGETVGLIDLSKDAIDSIQDVFGDKKELKLLVCNTESPLGKEFKEQFDIQSTYYCLTFIDDKRLSIGKEKNMKEKVEERISINQ